MSVAIPIPLLQHLPDVNVTPAVGVDEYALVWDNDTARFVLRAPAENTAGIFLFPTFVNNEDLLRFSYSLNGTDWKTPDRAFFTPASGLLRDPDMIYRDGYYYIVYTAGDFGNVANFAIIRSADLINWTAYKTVSTASIVTNPGLGGFTWSPLWFIDEDSDTPVRVFISLSTDTYTTMRVYEVHPLTDDLSGTWSEPALVTGDFPNPAIALRCVKKDGDYYIWYKDDATNYIEIAVSTTSPVSGYSAFKTGNWAGWGANLEGAALHLSDDGTWTVWFDNYPNKGIYYSRSSDDWATWSGKAYVNSVNPMSNPSVFFTRNANRQADIITAFVTEGRLDPIKPKSVAINSTIPATPSTPGFERCHIFLGSAGSIESAGTTTNYRGTLHINSNCYSGASPHFTLTPIVPTIPQWHQFQSAENDSWALFRAPANSTSFVMLAQVDNAARLTVSKLRVTTTSPPASASAAGTAGEIAWDANYIYVCTAANTWKRTAIATW